MKRAVLVHPNPELKIASLHVDEARFGSDELNELVKDLKEAMEEDKGIGIAAPQVGVHDRLIIVDMADSGPTAFVNPKIVSRSMSKIDFEEGCLSVPGVYGMVERHKKVKVKAYSQDGYPVTLSLKGTLAVVFQHEIDHLDGILFIEKVKVYTHGGNVQI
ncbi:peptide deformylase [Candidatus Uhrbacteria bacterium]|nr:peptide deformylase [Candidatus Uhrbacteria bacterium]